MRNKKLIPILGFVVVLGVGAFVFVQGTRHFSSQDGEGSGEQILLEEDSLQVSLDALGENVLFVDYSGETDMQIMLYQDQKGTIHGALNTCQVCNGSPYAYFEQEGDDVVCQNCGNHFALQDLGVVRGGCNPVPLEFTQDDGKVKIETDYLYQNAYRFVNWKQGV